jgi:DNA-binding NtrC family response regulator
MGIKVLLVDDEEEFTSLLSERMKTRGFDVDVTNSGIKALERIDEKVYDAIILDLYMPEMDGIETLKRLLKKNPDLQIIFLTGHATLEKGIEAVKLGAREFMEKPVDMDKLIEKVNDAKTKKDILSEEKSKKDIDDLLKKKGW